MNTQVTINQDQLKAYEAISKETHLIYNFNQTVVDKLDKIASELSDKTGVEFPPEWGGITQDEAQEIEAKADMYVSKLVEQLLSKENYDLSNLTTYQNLIID